MSNDGTIYHNDNLRNEVGGRWWVLGENVGMGPSCASLHDAFMDSGGHRRNILDRDFNQVGVGVSILDDVIYVTEVFAGRRADRATSRKPKLSSTPRPSVKAMVSPPRTVGILLMLLRLDSDLNDPVTGRLTAW